MKIKKKRKIKIPNYSLGEEIFNSISHGIGAGLSIAMLVLLIIKAHGALAITTVSIFGSTSILLYLMSCIYHALSKNIKGKKVLRVLDHINVYLLVLGTYIPVCLVGVKGPLGWTLFGIVCFISILGIIFTAIDIDKYENLSVILHLINGWSIIIGIVSLLNNVGFFGVLYFIIGGLTYSVGSIIYKIGAKKRYMHCVFHIFCLFATFFHFIGIYFYML